MADDRHHQKSGAAFPLQHAQTGALTTPNHERSVEGVSRFRGLHRGLQVDHIRLRNLYEATARAVKIEDDEDE